MIPVSFGFIIKLWDHRAWLEGFIRWLDRLYWGHYFHYCFHTSLCKNTEPFYWTLIGAMQPILANDMLAKVQKQKLEISLNDWVCMLLHLCIHCRNMFGLICPRNENSWEQSLVTLNTPWTCEPIQQLSAHSPLHHGLRRVLNKDHLQVL